MKNVVHEAVKNHLANCRQGTQSALTRAEVSGGGKKPWRQKGTGHARQGSTRAPQWTHGGIVFAPKPRDYQLCPEQEGQASGAQVRFVRQGCGRRDADRGGCH
jgi:50S ribosomal protein L4